MSNTDSVCFDIFVYVSRTNLNRIPTELWEYIQSFLEGSNKTIISLLETSRWFRYNCTFTRLALDFVHVTRRGMRAIAGINGIKSIGLSNCTGIDAHGIDTLASVQSLTSLDLSGIDLTEQSLDALAQLNLLNELYLCDTNINDEALLFIASQLPCLERLYICWCVRITSEGVIQMAEHCEKLKVLDLTGCSFDYDEESEIHSTFCPKGVHIVFSTCDDYVSCCY